MANGMFHCGEETLLMKITSLKTVEAFSAQSITFEENLERTALI